MYEEFSMAERGNVLLQAAFEESDGFGTPQDMGCLIGSVTEDDGMGPITMEVNTWCQQRDRANGVAGIAQSRPGDREWTVAFDLAVIVADSSTWKRAYEAYRSRENVQLVITVTDEESSVSTLRKTLTGYFSQFNTEYPQEGIAHSPITFQVLDEEVSFT